MLMLLLAAPLGLARDRDRDKDKSKDRFLQPVPIHLDKGGKKWADKTLRKMSPEEKVGQLFGIKVLVQFLNDADPKWIELRDSVQKYHVGSLVMTVPVEGPVLLRSQPAVAAELLNRLQQLNKMPPEQRQRTVDRIEAMEHLTPQMRQQVRASFQDFRSLPPDRQRMVRKAFRDLREYPPEQRTAMMNSPKFQAQFSPQERSILSNILAVEPYQAIHGPRPEDGLEYGR